MKKQTILILDAGSANNQFIARRIRDCNVYCEVLPLYTQTEEIREKDPELIILSGDVSSPTDNGIFENGYDIVTAQEDFSEKYKITMDSVLSAGTIGELKEYLKKKNFRCDWTMEKYAEQTIAELREKIGANKVLLALSGGVDSSVCASLLGKAIGHQLTCIFVDTGLMRKHEPEEVRSVFGSGVFNYVHVEAESNFLGLLAGVTDPEKKRKIIGAEFIRVFENEAKKIGKIDYLAQGTIYPDIIESGTGGKKAVKSHHNVGGLPDHIDFKELIEPLKYLFKDEVRELGRKLGLPDNLVNRQPFPGPGLSVRVIGEVTKPRLETLRDADYIFREEISKAGFSTSISQYFAILTEMKSVGVRAGERTYEHAIALRAVCTTDFMEAKWSRIPYEVLETVSERIVCEVAGVNRILYDVTGKPPATIEWE